jgi:thiamine monophosphate kinase
MEDTILESGTIVKNKNGEDFELITRIDIESKKDIEDFVGDTPWEEVKVIGYAERDKINLTLNSYECIEDLIQCCELNPPEWLSLKIGEDEYEIVV